MFLNNSRLFRLFISSREDRPTPRESQRRQSRLLVEQLESRTLLNSNVSLPFVRAGANTPEISAHALFATQGLGLDATLQSTGDAVISLGGSPASLRLHFVGGNPHLQPIGIKLAGGAAAFTPIDAQSGESGVDRVKFRNVYPGIDVVYKTQQDHLQFIFLVHPGANPRKIQIAYQGAQGLELDAQGNVIVTSPTGQLLQEAPLLFQKVHGVRRKVDGQYRLDAKGRVHFQIGSYNPRRAVMIDPWINNPPVAVDDCYATLHGRQLVVGAPGVLGNDHDADGDPLTPILVDGPSHGSLTLNTDGSFTYGRIAGFWGSDSFTYQDFDGYDYGNTATVCIEVTNQAPVANDDSYTIVHDHTLSSNVLTNDADPDGDAITAWLMNAPSHGTVTYFGENGDFIYAPDLHFVGADLFTYQVSDGAQTDSAQVTISVTNAAPAANDDTYGVHANSTINVSAQQGVLGNDIDGDGDALTASLGSGPAHGTLSFNDDGSFAYTPASGFSGDDSFTYTASDGVATSNTATVSLNVHGGNTGPVANGDSYVTLHDKPLNVAAPGVLANDTDVDYDLLSASLVVGPAHAASFTFNSDGSFSYAPAVHWTGTDQFTYQVSDGAATDDAIVSIIVENHAPSVTLEEPIACCLSDPTVLNGSFFDPDDPVYDGPYTLTVTWGDGNEEQHIFGAPNSFEYEHTYEQAGLYQIVAQVVDSAGAIGNRQVQAVVALVQRVEWVPMSDNVDTNPGNGTPDTAIGLRIYPDKNSPSDNIDRTRIWIEATIFPAVAGVKVYFAVVDVDDPSANSAPVDDEIGADNRGIDELHGFGATTDASGIAGLEFEVSMNPGDNWRAVASCRENDVVRLEGKQNDAPLLRVIDADGNFLPTGPARVSDVLTVWRRLHVEVDSMGSVHGNTVTGVITDVASDPEFPNAWIVTAVTATELTDPGDLDRFRPGVLDDFLHQTFEVISNSATDAEGNFTIVVRYNDGGQTPASGNFTLRDDDFLQDGDDVPMPDTSTLDAAMNEAYVKVLFDTGDNDDWIPFEANVEYGDDVAQWDGRPLNFNNYWVTYVLGAFQGRITQDFDPNNEDALLGQNAELGTSRIYLEVIVDFARKWSQDHVFDPLESSVLERDVVVHEVGHAVARNSKHPVTGLDAKLKGVAIGNTSPDGVLVTHHDPSRYTPEYLKEIRTTPLPVS